MLKIAEFRSWLKEVVEKHPKKRPMVGGKLVPDPVPMAPPVGYVKQISMIDQVRDMVRSERLRQEVEAAGMETFEEADDFEVGDDYDPTSPYEEVFDPVEMGLRRKLTDAEYDAKVEARLNEARSKIGVGDGDVAASEVQRTAVKGRVADGSVGSRRGGKVGKGDANKNVDADDEAGS